MIRLWCITGPHEYHVWLEILPNVRLTESLLRTPLASANYDFPPSFSLQASYHLSTSSQYLLVQLRFCTVQIVVNQSNIWKGVGLHLNPLLGFWELLDVDLAIFGLALRGFSTPICIRSWFRPNIFTQQDLQSIITAVYAEETNFDGEY